jgi:hypothetical protein
MIEDNTPLDIKRNKKINQIINEKDWCIKPSSWIS